MPGDGPAEARALSHSGGADRAGASCTPEPNATPPPADDNAAEAEPDSPPLDGRDYPDADDFCDAVIARMKCTVVWRFGRDAFHPNFAGADDAATSLVSVLTKLGLTRILTTRHPVLRHVREKALAAGLVVLIPSRRGEEVWQLPPSAMDESLGRPLRIDPPPPGTLPYAGEIDAVIVPCLAFDAESARLISLEPETTAVLLNHLTQDGTARGCRLRPDVRAFSMASDEQQVTEPPAGAISFVRCDAVLTPAGMHVLPRHGRSLVCDPAGVEPI